MAKMSRPSAWLTHASLQSLLSVQLTLAANETCGRRTSPAGHVEHAALGHNFHGEGRQRGFPLEDQYVFENFFSTQGGPPYHRNGTFLELGAHDGVHVSNTVWLERALGWSGVLIEASSAAFARLGRSRGNARNTLRNTVVCPQGQTVEYLEPTAVSNVVMAGIRSSMPGVNQGYSANRNAKVRKLPCSPLGAILREAGVDHVDFFSLDVEGAEFIVMQTIDWSAVTFGVVMVELDGKAPSKDIAVRKMLRANGYAYHGVTGSFCRAEIWLGRRNSNWMG